MPKTTKAMTKVKRAFATTYGPSRGPRVMYASIMAGTVRGRGIETKAKLKAGIRRAARKRAGKG